MTEKKPRNAINQFFHDKRALFESLQENSFERGEKKLIELLSSENEPLDYPIPIFMPVVLVWLFLLIFPVVLIVDPGYILKNNVDAKSVVGFYLPLLLTLCMFLLNQKVLVPKFVFKKLYVHYFVSNSVLLMIALFLREVTYFFLERTPGDSWGYFFKVYCFSEVKGHFSFWTVVVFVALVVIVCFICVVYQMMLRQIVKTFILREQKRVTLQYELDFLKNQLSPHFLFNTLNNISALIRIDPKMAESSMDKLSKLLRVMLYQTADKFIELQEDVDILQKYADLEKLRLDENFDLKFNVKLQDPHRNIEPLLVMPLMENAMKHCINPNGKGFAHISIEQDGDVLTFRSENSNFPRKSQRKASGLGLVTFEKRLKLLYDRNFDYSTSIKDGVYICQLTIKLRSGNDH